MRQLLHRRVPQIVGAYLATSWILLEFTDWAVNQYALSPNLTNFVVTGLLLLLPAVAVLAWRHGAPGEDGWTRIDGAVIGLNLILAGSVLAMLFSGKELGAATTVRLLEDDDGNTVERVLPKAEFRRDLVVWDFDNESGDPELDWLRVAFLMGLQQDLYQDMWVTPVDAQDPRVRTPLAEAGFEVPYDVPLALKRRLAERTGVGHFLVGEIAGQEGDSLVVRTRLYETRNAREVSAQTYRGTDPLEMTDRISVDVRRDLGIPEWQIEESVDLPVAEMFTESPEALRAIAKTRPALLENRLGDVRLAAREAAEADPSFATAYAAEASSALLMGDQAAARDGIAEALRHSYRLPERSRLLLQMLDRMLFRMDPEGALQAGSYWIELYPQDLMARQLLAQAHAMQGDIEGMIVQFRALLAMDSTNVQAIQSIAAGFRGQRQYDSALVYYDRLSELQPSDVQTRLDIAATHTSLLEFDEARAELERARGVAPDDPNVYSQLARLDMRVGRYDDAAVRIEEMSDLARTPQHRNVVEGVRESYYYDRGQYGPLRAAYLDRVAAISEFSVPIQGVQQVLNSEVLLYAADWGQEAFALQQLDSLRATVSEPWSYTVEVPAVWVHLDREDVESARESLAGLVALNEAFGEAPGRVARHRWVEGRIAWIEDGDCERALWSFREAQELSQGNLTYLAWSAACLTELERYEEAEADVALLVERLPASPKIRVVAARLYAGQGRTEDAVAALEVALAVWAEADSDFRPAAEARALLEELQAAG
ncbi:MAG: tetratricopeptide repeat protein [marine benthic group bacterium]|nr:tetratricopeptide repeat protein [Gemmatimonadota bacterium]